jgi:antitoxin ParD1/3/4
MANIDVICHVLYGLLSVLSEFMRDLLRQHKSRQEAAAARDAILEGYQDAINGRMHPFKGNLRSLLKKLKY